MGLLDNAESLARDQVTAEQSAADAARSAARKELTDKVSQLWGGLSCVFAGALPLNTYTYEDGRAFGPRRVVKVPRRLTYDTYLLAEEIRLSIGGETRSAYFVGTCERHGDYEAHSPASILQSPHKLNSRARGGDQPTREEYEAALVASVAGWLRSAQCPLCEVEQEARTCPTCGLDMLRGDQ